MFLIGNIQEKINKKEIIFEVTIIFQICFSFIFINWLGGGKKGREERERQVGGRERKEGKKGRGRGKEERREREEKMVCFAEVFFV